MYALSRSSVSATANVSPSFGALLLDELPDLVSGLRGRMVVAATTTSPWALYSSLSSARCGIIWMHGPHQMAQKSTT